MSRHGSPRSTLDDAAVFGAGPRAVMEVQVAGETIVRDGVHRDWDAIRVAWERTLGELT